MSSRVTVSIVLHESARDIGDCLAALRGQTRPPDDVVVLDNASRDDGADRARAAFPEARIIVSPMNLGFAAGHNRAMAAAPAEAHLVLNPDARPSPDFLERALAALWDDPRNGSVSGRLLRFDEGEGTRLIDSTGLRGLRNRRVLDRGSDEPDDGRYGAPGYVFGASGAAALYRREMLEDAAFEGQVFDEAFFAYREDVDLAWRAQLLGWRCRYEPTAVASHRRRVTPERRRQLPAQINRWSIANRWRMLAKNELPVGWRRDWAPILARDAGIVGYCVLREQRSLSALTDVLRDAPRLRAWRRDLMRRRRADDEAVLAWFGRVEQLPMGAS